MLLACRDAVEPPLALPLPSAIAFALDRSGNRDVFILQADGQIVQVTDHAAFDGSPDWAPDGRALAFYSARDGNFEIYGAGADGSNPRRLTEHPAADAHPDWVPDGTRIAFHSDRDGCQRVNLTRHAAFDAWPDWRPLPRGR